MKIVVTGANSSVGKHLLHHLADNPDFDIVACVRSDAAAKGLPTAANIQSVVVSYQDESALSDLMQDASAVVHLAGILIESRSTTYQDANVETTVHIVEAAKSGRAKHLIFISVVGADFSSGNPYYRSKGEAEKRVNESELTATILRTPILLGPATAGGRALMSLASRSKSRVLGGGHYIMRPLDVDDLCRAIVSICQQPPPKADYYELVGPEAISYRALIERMGARLGRQMKITSLPVGLAKLAAAVTSRLRGAGITPAVIDVITGDETVVGNADQILGINLTPLDNTLENIINNNGTAHEQ